MAAPDRDPAESTLLHRPSSAPRSLVRLLPPIAMALPVAIFCVAKLSVALAAAQALGLSTAQATSLVAALHVLPGAASLALTLWSRQPLLVTWSSTGLVFLASFAGRASYEELAGALVVAGAAVAVLGALGLADRVAARLPAPIVFGMLAGALLPFIGGIFTSLGATPLATGGVIGAYLLSRGCLPARIPALLPALLAGVAAASLTGDLTTLRWSAPVLAPLTPAFSAETLVSAAPVLAVLILVQGNLSAVVYIREQGYRPPVRVINVVTGLATMAGSFAGLTPICMAAFLTAPTAGPAAGDLDVRHWSVHLSAAALLGIALLAGVAGDLLRVVPLPLLLALAGLALVDVFADAVQQMARGPLALGPILAFAVAVSPISLLGFGPFFWALVVGLTVSLLLERDALRALGAGRSR